MALDRTEAVARLPWTSKSTWRSHPEKMRQALKRPAISVNFCAQFLARGFQFWLGGFVSPGTPDVPKGCIHAVLLLFNCRPMLTRELVMCHKCGGSQLTQTWQATSVEQVAQRGLQYEMMHPPTLPEQMLVCVGRQHRLPRCCRASATGRRVR